MSWNYRLDTPMMQLAEEVNKKYDTDSGNMLLCTYLFMVSSEEVKDKQAFFDWVEELSKSCKCDANGNEELASRICNYALDSILVENPDLALRKRLDKEQKGEDAPDGFSNVIEIKGDDAKKLVETICGILRKDE